MDGRRRWTRRYCRERDGQARADHPVSEGLAILITRSGAIPDGWPPATTRPTPALVGRGQPYPPNPLHSEPFGHDGVGSETTFASRAFAISLGRGSVGLIPPAT